MDGSGEEVRGVNGWAGLACRLRYVGRVTLEYITCKKIGVGAWFGGLEPVIVSLANATRALKAPSTQAMV